MSATFSAALLAGGKSRRLGRDKALLPVTGHAHLWQRQLALLDGLSPQTVFWSGPARDGLPPHVVPIADPVPDAGPLAGIVGCLDALESDRLLVLAVDLPRMGADFLRRLLESCPPAGGAVPRGRERFEPLAAVYPKALLPLARAHLHAGRLALQDLAARGVREGMLRVVDLADADLLLFRNLNRPEDLNLLA